MSKFKVGDKVKSNRGDYGFYPDGDIGTIIKIIVDELLCNWENGDTDGFEDGPNWYINSEDCELVSSCGQIGTSLQILASSLDSLKAETVRVYEDREAALKRVHDLDVEQGNILRQISDIEASIKLLEINNVSQD